MVMRSRVRPGSDIHDADGHKQLFPLGILHHEVVKIDVFGLRMTVTSRSRLWYPRRTAVRIQYTVEKIAIRKAEYWPSI